jgi:tetratricopeptide (TPR) repeat protein
MSASEEFFEVLAAFRDANSTEDEQIDFEIEFYQQILRHNPTYVDVLRRLVEHLSRRGDYRRALPRYRQLIELCPDDCIARYNLSCTLAMLGRLEQAVHALEEAFQSGYHDIAHLESDSDMELLRDHPVYLALLDKYDMPFP